MYRLLNLGIVIFVFGLVFVMKYFYKKYSSNRKVLHNAPPTTSTNSLNSKFNKYFLLGFGILFVVVEIIKIFVFAFYYQDQRLGIYLSIHICSLPLYLLPILIFTKSNTNVHKIVFNFTLVTTFLCAFTFMIGFDTPDIFDKSESVSVFYQYHTYLGHGLLALLFAYLVVFGFERMYPKFHWQVVVFILLVNTYIFIYAEVLRGAGFYYGALQGILYNHDMEPIFSWCNKNPYLTNFVLFILTLSVYEGVYFAYFYIEKTIRNYWAKKHHLRISK